MPISIERIKAKKITVGIVGLGYVGFPLSLVFAGKGANEASKMLGVGLSIVSGIAASAAVSTAFGFPITFYAGFVLTCTVVSIIAIATFAYSFATAPSAA